MRRTLSDQAPDMFWPCRYHQYKFIVDGEWRHDEAQPFMPDPLGNVNNWLFVRKPEMYVALSVDVNDEGFAINQCISSAVKTQNKLQAPKLAICRSHPARHLTIQGFSRTVRMKQLMRLPKLKELPHLSR